MLGDVGKRGGGRSMEVGIEFGAWAKCDRKGMVCLQTVKINECYVRCIARGFGV